MTNSKASERFCWRVAMAIALVTMLLTPGSAWSWGRIGHRISAKLAETHLTLAALAEVRNLLEPGESLAQLATRADEQREAAGTGPWHYVEVPITEPRYSSKFCPLSDNYTHL